MAKSAPAVCEVLPPLPCESVDIDALAAALDAGATGEDAIAAAIVAPLAPEAADEPVLEPVLEPVTEPAADPALEPEAPADLPDPETITE